MSRREELPGALRALLEAARAIMRASSTAQLSLASLAEVLPPEWVEGELAAARERVGPVGARDVERVLRDAWRTKPSKVLDDLDLGAPLAVGPFAQRHRGELDGAAVEVEVQRPGLAAAVRNDLALLDALAAPLAAAFPALDAGRWLRAARDQVLDELDLEHVAGMQRQVGRALRRVEEVVVPAVHMELAAPTAYVADALEGPTLADAPPADAGDVAAALVRAHLVAARDGGLALTDPRASDVVVLRDGTLGLRRAGLVAPVERERVRLALRGALAVRDDAPSEWADAAAGLGLLAAADAAEAHALAARHARPYLAGPAALDPRRLARTLEDAWADLPALFAVARRASPDPADLPLARSAGQLTLLLARLRATHDWGALLDHR